MRTNFNVNANVKFLHIWSCDLLSLGLFVVFFYKQNVKIKDNERCLELLNQMRK